MSLELPPNFAADIQSRDTNIFPVVHIESPDSADGIWISTNVPNFGSGWKPILLNIPSLKESINISTRKYSISSVNLDISNFPYEGNRFSELIGSNSLINRECRIFWCSQSTTGINFIDTGADYTASNAFQIYFGTIRRYTHDDEKVRLVVEDRSQATLHRDLPIANLGTGDEVPDRYKNKPIPMVYGHVDRSPCVIKSSVADESEQPYLIKLSVDNDSIESYKEDSIALGSQYIPQSALYFYKNDKYYNIQRYVVDDPNTPDMEETAQSNFSYLPTTGEINFDYTDGNFTNNNNLGIYLIREFIDTTGHNTEHWGFTSNAEQIYNATTANYDGTNELELPLGSSNALTNNESEFCLIKGSVVAGRFGYVFVHFNLDVVSGLEIGKEFNNDGVLVESPLTTYLIAKIEHDAGSESGEYLKWGIWDGGWGGNYSELTDDSYTTLQEHWSGFNFLSHGDYNSYSGTDGNFWLGGFDGVNQMSYIRIGIPGQIRQGVEDGANADYEDGDYFHFETKIYNAFVYHNFKVDGISDKDFYANVYGRGWTTYWPSPSLPEVIANILNTELGQDVTPQDSGWDNWDLAPHRAQWRYAFTVDKKINSKKLIEGIASASPFIPRFNNMGKFRFDLIPTSYVSSDIEINHTDVIDFSYSRTKIEDVYTKVVFKYNWDYARGEFQSSKEADISLIPLLDDGSPIYDPEYYGFKTENGEYDHAESTLVIDDDRGKYIRFHTTADHFVGWYLLWSCNQKLKLKVKLPLKYLRLEIGDLVYFDSILGGVKPYGINYARITDRVNGQTVFNNFIITSTNKGLDSVEIECLQLPDLSDDCWLGYDCFGICGGDAVVDDCGVCGGVGGDEECECEDIPEGACNCNGAVLDECGVCGGDSTTCDDECGEAGGDGSSCVGCDFSAAENWLCDPQATNTPDCCEADPIGGFTGGFGDCTPCSDCCSFGGTMCIPAMAIAISQTGFEKSFIMTRTGAESNPDSKVDPIYLENFADIDICNPMFINSTASEDGIFRIIARGRNIPDGRIYGQNWKFYFNKEIVNNAEENPDAVVTDVNVKVLSNDDRVQINTDINTESTSYEYSSWYNYTKVQGSFKEGVDPLEDDVTQGVEIFKLLEGSDGVIEDGEYAIVFRVEVTTVDGFSGESIRYYENVPVIYEYTSCSSAIGDINGDSSWNVLDIVALANCVLNDNCNDLEVDGVNIGCAADMNVDGGWNVLDIVILANCVLADNCGG